MVAGDFQRMSVRKPGTQLIDKGSFERLHDATLDVLEKDGLRVHSGKALALLHEHGADADRKSLVVKFPRHMVGDALRSVPSGFTLRARNRRYDLKLDGRHVYFTFDGCGVQAIDLDTGRRRPARKQDIVDTARIADHLPGVGYYTPPVAPQDVPLHAHVLHQVHTGYTNTEKFVMSESTTTALEAKLQIEMATAVAGGEKELWRSPSLSAVVCSVSPLILDGGGSEAAIEFARAGIPINIMSMAQAGVSSPATIAGNLLVNNAEMLGLLTLAQCAKKGARLMYSSALATTEPRTGAYVSGAPEAVLTCAAAVELGKHYGMPAQASAFGTNALEPGSQAAAEHMMTAMTCINSGADMLNGFGLLEGSTVLSYEQMMLDYDIVTELLATFKGIEVDDETLARDLMSEVGIAGNYLAKRHTLEHLREAWQPLVYEFTNFEDWSKRGAVSPVRKANQIAKAILREHMPVPPETDTVKELDEVLRRGEKELAKASTR